MANHMVDDDCEKLIGSLATLVSHTMSRCRNLSVRLVVGTRSEALSAAFTLADDMSTYNIIVPIQPGERREAALLDAFSRLEDQMALVAGRAASSAGTARPRAGR